MKLALLILLLCTTFVAFSQEDILSVKTPKKNSAQLRAATPKDRKEFYNYYMPSSIAKLDFSPAAISNLSIDFGDDEITLKIGQPFKKVSTVAQLNNSGDKKSFSNSWFVGGSFTADEGVKKIISGGKINPGYTLKGGVTFKTVDRRWVYVSDNTKTSSRQYQWVNVVAKTNWTNYNIFAKDTLSYKKQDPFGFQVVVSYSNYFHSEIKKYKKGNSIASGGLGFGRFNNYSLLSSEFSYLQGRILPNGNYVQTDEVKGRIGEFNNFYAAVYFADFYKSLIRAEKATLYLGGRINGYLGQHDNINSSLGLYFSKTSTSTAGEKEEKVGFVIAGNFPNTQKFDWNEYMKTKAYLNFAAVIPLRFGL
jgi:hypothetical protein